MDDEDDRDGALVARVARGDEAAFEALFRRHHRALYGFARRLTGRDDMADEIAGEALDVLWRRAGAFRGEARVTTWLFGVVYRLALKARGRAARRAEDALEADDHVDPAAEAHGVEAAFRRAEVARALDRLTPEHRAVIELTYYHGLSVREIAAALGRPEGTVKTRMMHARARLRALLGPPEKENGDD